MKNITYKKEIKSFRRVSSPENRNFFYRNMELLVFLFGVKDILVVNIRSYRNKRHVAENCNWSVSDMKFFTIRQIFWVQVECWIICVFSIKPNLRFGIRESYFKLWSLQRLGTSSEKRGFTIATFSVSTTQSFPEILKPELMKF